MAIPWYSPDLPLDNFPETNNLNFVSTENGLVHHNIKKAKSSPLISNTKLVSMSAVRNIIIKSNNLFKWPERDIDKISTLTGEDEEHNLDSSDDYAGHTLYHTELINRAFLPMRLVLMVVGRWPFTMKFKKVTSRAKRRNCYNYNNGDQRIGSPITATKVKNYDATLKSPLWISFGLSTLFLAFVLVMSTLGFFDFFLAWKVLPGNPWENEEDIFRDNLVVFLVVWGCLLHSTVSSLSLFINRKKVAKILNFWNVAADELVLDEIKSHKRFLMAANVGFILFLLLLYFAYNMWNIRLIRDAATLFGILAVGPLLPEEWNRNALGNCSSLPPEEQPNICKGIRIFGIVTIFYAIYASRALLILFCFKCRLLRSLFRVWNTRLVKFLRQSENNMDEKRETREIMEKMECQHLLSDMTILLKMVKQMDNMFATVLEAYYGVQLLNMCFELYMLAKSGSKEFNKSDEDNSRLDIITAVLTLCQNVYFFFTVSLDGAYVGEEADKGHDALRRHVLCPHSTTQKKFLVYNLGFTYNKRIVLTGGKFFTVDRPFIITVLGAVLTYFVIILQVEPSLKKISS